jgi:hypothetical protein
MGTRAARWIVPAALAAFAHPPPAGASELKVHSPLVELGEFNLEWNGLATVDSEGSPNNARRTQTFELGYAVLPFWRPEIEFERETVEGRDKWSEITFENTFQLTPTGKYFVDVGLFAAYSQSLLADEPSAVTAGPILRKTLDLFGLDTRHTLNLFLSREIGHNRTDATGFAGAWQSVWRASPLFAPGFEAYSFIDDLAHRGRFNAQYHSLGPVIVGGGELDRFGALRYEIGYQFGLSSGAPRRAVRWKLEYEIAF